MASNNFTSELECTVCFEIPKIEAKVFQCNSGHILCQTCYVKLVVCPMCQKTLVRVSDVDNQYGPIRCLTVENLIQQLPNMKIVELDTLETEVLQREVASQASDLQITTFANKRKIKLPINHKVHEKKLGKEEKDFNVGGLGSTEVFIVAKDSKYGTYWGKRLPKDCDGLRRADNLPGQL